MKITMGKACVICMKICVVGLGYIGLPTSVMFASHGCEVVGVDTSEYIVNHLNEGKIVIEEPGLDQLAKECVSQGNLRASMKPETADAYIIAVPTPFQDDEAKSCDLTYVLEAVNAILPYVKKGDTVIVESTIAPLSMEDYVLPLFQNAGFQAGKDVYVAHCPERVLPGKIIEELQNNNRIIGGITPECAKHAAKVYQVFVKGEFILTEAKTAELSKCMENTFRDVNIALVNELAKVCNELNINCLDVIEMANKHPRVNLLQPGPGVGGHCLAIDPYFICAKAPETARLIKLARDINSSMPYYVVSHVERMVRHYDNPKIAVFGASYKGNIDDIRESPAIKIIKLLKQKYQVKLYDPHVHGIETVSIEEAVQDADLILVLVEHNEFKHLDHALLASMMRHPVLFDTRNMIEEQPESGMTYINYGSLYRWKD